MKNKSSNIHNVDLNLHCDKELEKKNRIFSPNPQTKKFNDLNYKNDLKNKKESKGDENFDIKRKIKQSCNFKVSKDLKNKFDIKENEEYISKQKKQNSKAFKSNIDNNNEFVKEEESNKKSNQSKDEKNQNILINSINEIRLPRKLMDISCDLMMYG